MKMILGLLKADQGSIQVLGEKVAYGETKTNKNVGYLPDVPEFYGYMKPLEYLKLCGEITGLSKDQIKTGAMKFWRWWDLAAPISVSAVFPEG